MNHKLKRRYFLVGLLDVCVGAAEMAFAEGRFHMLLIGVAFLAIGTINFYNCYKISKGGS